MITSFEYIEYYPIGTLEEGSGGKLFRYQLPGIIKMHDGHDYDPEVMSKKFS